MIKSFNKPHSVSLFKVDIGGYKKIITKKNVISNDINTKSYLINSTNKKMTLKELLKPKILLN